MQSSWVCPAPCSRTELLGIGATGMNRGLGRSRPGACRWLSAELLDVRQWRLGLGCEHAPTTGQLSACGPRPASGCWPTASPAPTGVRSTWTLSSSEPSSVASLVPAKVLGSLLLPRVSLPLRPHQRCYGVVPAEASVRRPVLSLGPPASWLFLALCKGLRSAGRVGQRACLDCTWLAPESPRASHV